jgi:ribosomal protein S9
MAYEYTSTYKTLDFDVSVHTGGGGGEVPAVKLSIAIYWEREISKNRRKDYLWKP